MSMRQLTRGEAKTFYENGEMIAITFDNKNPLSRVYEFSVQTGEEPDFDSAVMYFETKKIMWYMLEYGKPYEEVTGQKHTIGFYKITEEQE